MSDQTLASQQPALPGRGLQFLDSLRQHSRLAVISFFAIVFLGLPLVFIKGVPKYQATATVHVAARYMKNIRDDNELDYQSNSQYRQFVEQQTKTINRYDILETALRSLSAQNTEATGDAGKNPWQRDGESERRAIERLQRELRILPVPDTYLIQISLEGDTPHGLDQVVNAVVTAYVAKAREEQIYGADERVRNLRKRESELVSSIDTLTRQRSEIANELGVTAFKVDDGNPFDKLAQKLREDIAEARGRRFDAEAKQSAFGKTGETDLVTRSIQESVLVDPGLNSLKSSLNKRRADLLTAISGLAAEHPGYQAARQEIAEIDAELRRHTEQLSKQLHEGMLKRHMTAVDQAKRLESDLQASLEEANKRSAAYAARFNQAATMTADLEQLRKELDTVRERLDFLSAENGSLGLVRAVTPAMVPDQPYGAGKKKLLLLVIAAALAGSLLLPMVLNLLDRRIRTPHDAQRCLGFAPLGSVIERNDAAGESFANDQLRRLASGLIREQDRTGTHAIAFTGVKPGAGTTRLVRDLAATLNRLGVPTLAVDANAFHPDAAYGSGPGLAALLEHPDSPAAINLIDGLPSLNVGTPAGQQQLDQLDHLGSVLAQLGKDYRFILIDAPPLLTASDSELIVRAAGSVVLVVEADAISQGEVKRAARLLEALDPPSVGAIVNRIAPFVGGGYLSSLMAEHASGTRQAPALSQGVLRDTLRVLAWDCAALALSGWWAIRRLPQTLSRKA